MEGSSFLDLSQVGLRGDDPLRGQKAHAMEGPPVGHFLDERTDDAQDAAVRVADGQVLLLDAPQGLGRRGVAGDDDEGAAPAEEVLDGLAGELVDHLLGAAAVGRTGVVAQVQVVILRQRLDDAPQHREPPETGVEKTNHSLIRYQVQVQVTG